MNQRGQHYVVLIILFKHLACSLFPLGGKSSDTNITFSKVRTHNSHWSHKRFHYIFRLYPEVRYEAKMTRPPSPILILLILPFSALTSRFNHSSAFSPFLSFPLAIAVPFHHCSPFILLSNSSISSSHLPLHFPFSFALHFHSIFPHTSPNSFPIFLIFVLHIFLFPLFFNPPFDTFLQHFVFPLSLISILFSSSIYILIYFPCNLTSSPVHLIFSSSIYLFRPPNPSTH